MSGSHVPDWLRRPQRQCCGFSNAEAEAWVVRYFTEGAPSLRDVARGHGESCGGALEAGGLN